MADKERAKKLAAAKKKLKAYKAGGRLVQTKEFEPAKGNLENTETLKLQNYFNKANCSELLISEGHMDFDHLQPNIDNPQRSPSFPINQVESAVISYQENNLNNDYPTVHNFDKEDNNIEKINSNNSPTNLSELLKTIEVLISEKAYLSKESSCFQISCKEKSFEIEELKTRLQGANKQIEELEQFYFNEQKKNVETVKNIQNLESELVKYKSQSEEFFEHIQELQRELSLNKIQISDMEREIKEKNSQLEISNVKICQISDENNITIDNRVETLTQTKFMYEQQIRDLQTMLQQLRIEKEQASQQFSNYVTTLSEKNSELIEDNENLANRERDLIGHISSLEKEIQNNISKKENLRQNMESVSIEYEENVIQENKFKNKIDELKILEEKLQKTIEGNEKEIEHYRKLVDDKSEEITNLLNCISNLQADRPNEATLLASMESDKVAASRAMSQNCELRKQLDEVQLKLIELTNDKMDLTNILDSERFVNKQTLQNFEDTQSQIKNLSEQLHFKDEEMIRLSHENNELNEKLKALQQTYDHIKQAEIPIGMTNKATQILDNCFYNNSFSDNSLDNLANPQQNNEIIHSLEVTLPNNLKRKDSDLLSLPTSEAICRLEERFKKLMGEVADLTDEKQQLEHIVLQLQSETETIGEYIALYQSQRKILKQKEYERDSQLNRLLAEREDLQRKALQLNNLMKEIYFKCDHSITPSLPETNSTLITATDKNLISDHNEVKTYIAQKEVEIAKTRNQQHFNSINEFLADNLTERDLQKINEKIQSLVADLKNKSDALPLLATSVDHCACCSGKFETI